MDSERYPANKFRLCVRILPFPIVIIFIFLISGVNYMSIIISIMTIIFFIYLRKHMITSIDIQKHNITINYLFGKKVFELNEKQVIGLMDEHGYELAESEEEPDGERRLSYDDALIDFFFHQDTLVAVNWGVLVNEQGEIEEF